ncbi:TorF family putative porin [Pseudomonas jilinensis]|uniref:Lipoprotein n=1 Tax=Pseudomonas jilinensis TaxID=2078689 RepID=A0A396RTT4_9PSED|nr:TorF family putative porin [Pseudomonas jilinensis]RHW20014.1 hypothetical protein C2846_15440 [Pseudomonas jilinensis]
MKKTTTCLCSAFIFGTALTASAESFDTPLGSIDASMSVTLASDYIWRGQSQTAGAGAIQGSLDFAHESGLYIGAWASNVDADTFGASIEIDYYLGFAGQLSDNLSYDLAWATYTYPKAGGAASVDEILASFSFQGLTIGSKYAYEPQSALYTYVSYAFELPYDLGLELHMGHTDTKDPLNPPADNGKTYRDWAVTLGKTLLGLEWALMYSDTNLKGSTCAAWYGKSRYCNGNLTLSVSKGL